MGNVQWLISPMMPSLFILYEGRLSVGFARLAQYEVMLDIFAVCWGLRVRGVSLDLGILACSINSCWKSTRAWMVYTGNAPNCMQGDWELWLSTWSRLPGVLHHILNWDSLLPSWSCLTFPSSSSLDSHSVCWSEPRLAKLSTPLPEKSSFDISYGSILPPVFQSPNFHFWSWEVDWEHLTPGSSLSKCRLQLSGLKTGCSGRRVGGR